MFFADDINLQESPEHNRWQDSEQIFKENCYFSSSYGTVIVIVLTRLDAFARKLAERKNFKRFFPEFKGRFVIGLAYPFSFD